MVQALSSISSRPTRLTGKFKLGTRPRNVWKTTTTAQQFRAKSYSIYEEIPQILKDIKIKIKFKKRLKIYYKNKDDLPHNRTYNNTQTTPQEED